MNKNLLILGTGQYGMVAKEIANDKLENYEMYSQEYSYAIVNRKAAVGDGCLLQCGSIVAAGTLMKMKNTLGYNEVLRDSDVHIDKRTPTGNDYKFEDGM